MRDGGGGHSNSHGARPVHQIISMIKWIRTSRLSIKNSLSLTAGGAAELCAMGEAALTAYDFYTPFQKNN